MPNQYTKGMSFAERFWSHVARGEGCWEWQSSLKRRDYGQATGRNGKSTGAHRVAWELTYGPIPPGLEVCHNCPDGDSPRCVRPDHLFLGTHQENMRDAGRKGRLTAQRHPERLARGERHGSRTHPEAILRGERATGVKLTEDAVRQIRALHRARAHTYKQLAAMFGVTTHAIDSVVHRRSWRHVE